MRKLQNVLVTGGAGFIGTNFIHFLFKNAGFSGIVVNVDKLTYASNLNNLTEIENKYGGKRYFFEEFDINDSKKIENTLRKYDIDTVVHFAAETHVDRSISSPKEFIHTNILGTFVLLNELRNFWKDRNNVIFHHISTDEVYGSASDKDFSEDSAYNPSSPYAASKASADHLVRAYHKTYKLPVTISNCSNNYGPYQFPEKVIPLMITNALKGNPLPVYGNGLNIRDWLHVDDHCDAVWTILNNGANGETYNIGTNNQWKNIDLVNLLCEEVSKITKKETKQLITFVEDRPGHDMKYAINADKLKNKLGWSSKSNFRDQIRNTVEWYADNTNW